jgi:hypothetical protein
VAPTTFQRLNHYANALDFYLQKSRNAYISEIRQIGVMSWFAAACECSRDRAPLFDVTWSRSAVSFTFLLLFYVLKKGNQGEGANRSKSLMYIFTAHKLPYSGKRSRALNARL